METPSTETTLSSVGLVSRPTEALRNLPRGGGDNLVHILHMAACGRFSTISSSAILTEVIHSNTSVIHHSSGKGLQIRKFP